MTRWRVTGRAVDIDDHSVINLGSVVVEAKSKRDARVLGHNQLWDERLNNCTAEHVVEELDAEVETPRELQ